MPEILQRTLDARVAPTRILGRHPHDQPADLREHTGPSRTPLRVRPFPGDELPVPAQNRVGRDDRRDLRQHPTTEPLAEASQPPPFVVGEPQALVAQLRLQDAVLFAQVLDDLVLFVLEPAEEGRDEQLHRNHGAESTPTAGRGFRTLRVFITNTNSSWSPRKLSRRTG